MTEETARPQEGEAPEPSGASRRGRIAAGLVAALALVVVGLGAWGVMWWLEGGGSPDDGIGPNQRDGYETPGGTAGPLEREERPPPEIGASPARLDFGEVAYVPGRREPAQRNLSLVLEGGGTQDVLVGRPEWQGDLGGTVRVTRGVDCFTQVRRPGSGLTEYCRLEVSWLPDPGAQLDATYRIRIAPHVSGAGLGPGPQWDPYFVTGTLVGRGAPAPREEPLSAKPEELELGPERAGVTVPARISLHTGPRAIEIESVLWAAPVADEAEIENLSCGEILAPERGEDRATCQLEVRWTGPGTFDNAVSVGWRFIGDHVDRRLRELVIPIRGVREEARTYDPDTVWLTATPPETNFGSWEGSVRESFEEQVVVQAGPEPVQIDGIRVTSVREGLARGVSADWQACGREGAIEIPAGSFCDLRMRWDAEPGNRVEGRVRITYWANTRRYPLEIPFKGELARESTAEMIDDSGTAARTRARADLRARREVPVLRPGVGVLQGGLPPRLRPVSEPLRAVDADYSEIGLAPQGGVSSRPVVLRTTVLRNTPIHAVLQQSFDARVATPVTAVVAKHVYSAQGRNVIIPRGSKIFGETVAFGNEDGHRGQLTGRNARIYARWERISRPDGTAFRVGDHLATLDEQGTAGIPGRVDPRELERYLHALTSSAAQVATILLLKEDEEEQVASETEGRIVARQRKPANEAANIMLGRLGQVADEIARESIPRPTIEVMPGTRIVLVPTVDLWLRPAAGHLAYAAVPEPGATDQQDAPPAPTPEPISQRTTSVPLTVAERRALEERGEGEALPDDPSWEDEPDLPDRMPDIPPWDEGPQERGTENRGQGPAQYDARQPPGLAKPRRTRDQGDAPGWQQGG